MRVLVLDNFDSFTWNLHHLLEPLVDEVVVARNDAITVDEAARFDRIVLSPGPGLPAEAGIMMDLLHKLMPTHPVLGVCLGMQGIVEACGGRLFNQPEVMHGRAVKCIAVPPVDHLFTGIEVPFEVGLYHSWAADAATLPSSLTVTAQSEGGVIMAVRHRIHAVCGVQFHPESVMTPTGMRMIANWIASP